MSFTPQQVIPKLIISYYNSDIKVLFFEVIVHLEFYFEIVRSLKELA